MGQQISVEAAYQSAQERAGELLRENILLKARVTELEKETEQLRAQQEQAAPYPSAESEPVPRAVYPVESQA